MIIQKPANDLRSLISLAEMKAVRESDGHLTIMRFQNHWKATLGILNPDSNNNREHESLEEALSYLIIGESE